MSIPATLRKAVAQRAAGRCEYCRLSQAGQEAAFHVDHIHPVAEQGMTEMENLALACVSCSLRKGARRRSRDPVTGRDVLLFHPRRQKWQDHFCWKGNHVQGTTAIGRATVLLLKMNRGLAVAIRAEERSHHRHPPRD
jgi:HNH endonuclease